MDQAVAALRAFNRFHTRFAGALDAHYMDTDLSLAEARLLYEIARRPAPLAIDLQTELGLDAGYVSRMLRRFQGRGWISRGRGADGRQRPIALTDQGRATFATMDEATRREVAERLAPLSDADREALVQALAAVQRLLGGDSAPWSIRTFRAGDLAAIASRQAILYEGFGWGRPMEILQGEITTAFLRDFRPGREQCWIAERAGTMAGSVLLVDAGGGTGQLRLLYVEPWARGRGIGERLVAACVAFAREAGYRKITLWTQSELVAARRLYERAGFVRAKEEPNQSFGRHDLVSETWHLVL